MHTTTNLIGFGVAQSEQWSTEITYTLNANGSGEANNSYRLIVPALSKTISKIRITVEAPSTGTFNCDNASVGIRSGSSEDTTATPTEFKFSTASGFSISNGATLVSDELTFAASVGQELLISIDVSSTNGNPRYGTSGTGDGYFFSNANTYATADVTATSTLDTYGIQGGIVLQKVEVVG